MSQRENPSAEEKIRIVEEYLRGKVGLWEAYERIGVGKAALCEW
jgi:transposase-like protein